MFFLIGRKTINNIINSANNNNKIVKFEKIGKEIPYNMLIIEKIRKFAILLPNMFPKTKSFF